MEVVVPNHSSLCVKWNNSCEPHPFTFRPKAWQSWKHEVLCLVYENFVGILCIKRQASNLTAKAASCLFYKKIFYTVDIFSLNNLLFLPANLEMQFGLIVFQLVSALLFLQKLYPRVTTNEGFRTLHKSLKHLLYTLNSPAQGILLPSYNIQACVSKPVRNIKQSATEVIIYGWYYS